MNWKNILKEVRGSHRRRFDFNNLDFYQDYEGASWRAIYRFEDYVTFSIIAGGQAYSKPRMDRKGNDGLLKDPMAYEKYEVMLDYPQINHPKEIGIMENTMIFSYKTKEEITEYARKVEANLPSKLKEKKQKKNLGRLLDAFKE
jgi:hypothetical protein